MIRLAGFPQPGMRRDGRLLVNLADAYRSVEVRGGVRGWPSEADEPCRGSKPLLPFGRWRVAIDLALCPCVHGPCVATRNRLPVINRSHRRGGRPGLVQLQDPANPRGLAERLDLGLDPQLGSCCTTWRASAPTSTSPKPRIQPLCKPLGLRRILRQHQP